MGTAQGRVEGSWVLGTKAAEHRLDLMDRVFKVSWEERGRQSHSIACHLFDHTNEDATRRCSAICRYGQRERSPTHAEASFAWDSGSMGLRVENPWARKN